MIWRVPEFVGHITLPGLPVCQLSACQNTNRSFFMWGHYKQFHMLGGLAHVPLLHRENKSPKNSKSELPSGQSFASQTLARVRGLSGLDKGNLSAQCHDAKIRWQSNGVGTGRMLSNHRLITAIVTEGSTSQWPNGISLIAGPIIAGYLIFLKESATYPAKMLSNHHNTLQTTWFSMLHPRKGCRTNVKPATWATFCTLTSSVPNVKPIFLLICSYSKVHIL